MKLLVDMNLTPDWVPVLQSAGWEAEHWSRVGNPRALDTEIMVWAHDRGWTVFTHDLDFGSLLALTHAGGPSVVQVRTQDVTPIAIGELVLGALRQFQSQGENRLAVGASTHGTERPDSCPVPVLPSPKSLLT